PPHPRRDLILAIVEEQPGLSFRALARATGIKWGTLGYHVSALIRSGAIWTVRHGQSLRHFAGRQPSPTEVRELLVEHALDEVDQAARLAAWQRRADASATRVVCTGDADSGGLLFPARPARGEGAPARLPDDGRAPPGAPQSIRKEALCGASAFLTGGRRQKEW